MAMTRAELEEVGVGIGIAEDKVAVARVDKADVELKQTPSARTGAVFDDGASVSCERGGLKFEAGRQPRLIDDHVGGLRQGRPGQHAKSETRKQKRLFHISIPNALAAGCWRQYLMFDYESN